MRHKKVKKQKNLLQTGIKLTHTGSGYLHSTTVPLLLAGYFSYLTLREARRLLWLFGAKCILARTAWYVVHMLKLQYHYASLDKFYNLNVWIVPASLYLKVGRFLLCGLLICMGRNLFSV